LAKHAQLQAEEISHLPSMSSNMIQECEELVDEGIANEFRDGGHTDIHEHPDKLVEWGTVSL
jgi:hypothetical protein